VKTQNRLLPEHIDKIAILTTTGKRKKYSHIATLEEVRDNDYNLNIRVMLIPLKRKMKLT
jgi:type I restriction enzyme M protein